MLLLLRDHVQYSIYFSKSTCSDNTVVALVMWHMDPTVQFSASLQNLCVHTEVEHVSLLNG